MLPLGREIEITALGKRWRIARLELAGVVEKFIDWVRPQLRDPFDGLDKIIDKLPLDLAREKLKEAEARCDEYETLAWDSETVKRFMGSTRGQMHLFVIMLQANHPEVTLDMALKIASEAADQLKDLFQTTNGRMPAPKPEAAPVGSPPAAAQAAGQTGTGYAAA